MRQPLKRPFHSNLKNCPVVKPLHRIAQKILSLVQETSLSLPVESPHCLGRLNWRLPLDHFLDLSDVVQIQ